MLELIPGGKFFENKIQARCDICNARLRYRSATREYPYKIKEAILGLPSCLLAGMEIYKCAKCRKEIPIIPRLRMLHRTIARTFAVKKDRITCEEFFFLRTFVGIDLTTLSAISGIPPSHLEEFEFCQSTLFKVPAYKEWETCEIMLRFLALTAVYSRTRKRASVMKAYVGGIATQYEGPPLFVYTGNQAWEFVNKYKKTKLN